MSRLLPQKIQLAKIDSQLLNDLLSVGRGAELLMSLKRSRCDLKKAIKDIEDHLESCSLTRLVESEIGPIIITRDGRIGALSEESQQPVDRGGMMSILEALDDEGEGLAPLCNDRQDVSEEGPLGRGLALAETFDMDSFISEDDY